MGKKRENENWAIQKSDEDWRAHLTPEQYHITREAGTERAFSGENWDSKGAGIYHCVCCDTALFASDTKFDSGTGWPSFFQSLGADAVAERSDNSLFMKRTEILCNQCGAHLGHVFPDGPAPTGQRYCMNGGALKLKPKDGA
ncbi:MAG: peptide-methionine (R)-S-oxide reductase MsrB [Alphaproteobacteria bacterium]|nr:peptide-methionine (R)-S-oxide reductase MsrB [Alphaproteobacteria bacterium]MBE8220141.1 peptide-methionine (R)-S-oxide reductase MsrB [Alphaproteobacteria bacterium]